jgi:hypothetical protein
MFLAGFEAAIPTSVRPQTLALDRLATWIGETFISFLNIRFLIALKGKVFPLQA